MIVSFDESVVFQYTQGVSKRVQISVIDDVEAFCHARLCRVRHVVNHKKNPWHESLQEIAALLSNVADDEPAVEKESRRPVRAPVEGHRLRLVAKRLDDVLHEAVVRQDFERFHWKGERTNRLGAYRDEEELERAAKRAVLALQAAGRSWRNFS